MVWNHGILCFHILRMSSSQLTNSIIFQRGRSSTKQLYMSRLNPLLQVTSGDGFFFTGKHCPMKIYREFPVNKNTLPIHWNWQGILWVSWQKQPSNIDFILESVEYIRMWNRSMTAMDDMSSSRELRYRRSRFHAFAFVVHQFSQKKADGMVLL